MRHLRSARVLLQKETAVIIPSENQVTESKKDKRRIKDWMLEIQVPNLLRRIFEARFRVHNELVCVFVILFFRGEHLKNRGDSFDALFRTHFV